MATCEIIWLLYFLKDIGVQHKRKALLFCDSQAMNVQIVCKTPMNV